MAFLLLHNYTDFINNLNSKFICLIKNILEIIPITKEEIRIINPTYKIVKIFLLNM